MQFLRDRWRRTVFCRYFEGLDQVDRATFWIAVALAFAIGISFSLIVRGREPAPALTAPLFELHLATT
jgi:hypothetical protein